MKYEKGLLTWSGDDLARWWAEAPDEVELREGMKTYEFLTTVMRDAHVQGIIAERCFAHFAGLNWHDVVNRRPTPDGHQFIVDGRRVKVAGTGMKSEGISIKVPRAGKVHYADVYVGFRIGKKKAEMVGFTLGEDMQNASVLTNYFRNGQYQNQYKMIPWTRVNRDIDLLRAMLGIEKPPEQGSFFL